jgi:hypothetical protein
MKTPHVGLSPIECPSKMNRENSARSACRTASSLLRDDREHLDVDPVEPQLRHVQQPVCATPEKSLLIIL